MRIPRGLIIAVMLLVLVVIQTSLFGQIRFIAPDLMMLASILLALTRFRSEWVLGIAFLSGLVVDLLGSSVLGLRAVVFTIAASIALRTRERAEIGRPATALWAGVISLIGVILLIVIGTLFGQSTLLGPEVFDRVLVVPIANMLLAAMFAPMFVRMVDGDSTAFRYS